MKNPHGELLELKVTSSDCVFGHNNSLDTDTPFKMM